jgi:hypothetical protein
LTSISCMVCGAATDAFMCARCGDKLEQALAELPAGIRDLEITATRQARVGNLPAPPKPDDIPRLAESETAQIPAALRSRMGRITLVETDLPFAPAAALLYGRAVNAIWTWTRHLTEARGLTYTGPANIDGMCLWLLTNLDSIRMDEAAAEIHTKVLALTAQIAATVDRQDPGVFAGPCNAPDVRVIVDGDGLRPVVSTCGADVMAKAGEPVATCSACGMAYDLAERKAWLLSQMPDHVASPRDIANALTSIAEPVTPSMIRQMGFRSEILPRGVDGRGYATYRVGDVLDVLARRAERKSRNGRMSA